MVDLASTQELQDKAPGLWAEIHTAGITFTHVQACSAQALQELRITFSMVWVRKFFRLGKQLLEDSGQTYPAAVETLSWTCEEIYNFRRDAEGVPYNHAARRKAPAPELRARRVCTLIASSSRRQARQFLVRVQGQSYQNRTGRWPRTSAPSSRSMLSRHSRPGPTWLSVRAQSTRRFLGELFRRVMVIVSCVPRPEGALSGSPLKERARSWRYD